MRFDAAGRERNQLNTSFHFLVVKEADMKTSATLEPEQQQLLESMVESVRDLPREGRGGFLLVATSGGSFLIHPSVKQRSEVYRDDLETLADRGFLRRRFNSSGGPIFDITSAGIAEYQEWKNSQGTAVDRIETEVRKYIDDADFADRHPGSLERWHRAERLLWGSDSTAELTNIGHLCREAMQEFASELLRANPIEDSDSDPTKTIRRINAVLRHRYAGEAVSAFLDALLAYWGTVSDLTQRQEHGAHKEGQPLVWEDARRVVFQTAMIFFEVDRTIR